jgi:hypothetical protein
MSDMMRLVGGAVAMVAAAGVLAGCGSGSSSAVDPSAGQSTAGSSSPSPSQTTSSSMASDLPACGEVWQAGAKLPDNYRGCLQGTNETRADRLGCSSGQRMVRFDNHWYAVLGGRIHHSRDLVHDAQYLHSVRVCRG